MDIYNKIRPSSWDGYIGQTNAKEILKLEIEYCVENDIPLRHIMVFGSAGLGKTTYAKIIANESKRPIHIVTGNTINDEESFLTTINNTLEKGKFPILFIDEIHLIKNEEMFYTLMTDNFISLSNKWSKLDTGEVGGIRQISPITIIGATTHSGQLLEAFRSRFNIQIQLEPYSIDELFIIVKNSSKKLSISITDEALYEIARNSQSKSRRANDMLISVSRVKGKKETADVTDVKTVCRLEKLYAGGLYKSQFDALVVLQSSKNNKLGLKSLATMVGMESVTWEYEFEPYLLQKKLITIGGGGRILTEIGKKYLEEI